MKLEELERLSRMDITCVPRQALVDIRDVRVDGFTPIEERFACFLDQIKNPYCFLYDTTPVRISFSEEGHTLHQGMAHYFISRKQG